MIFFMLSFTNKHNETLQYFRVIWTQSRENKGYFCSFFYSVMCIIPNTPDKNYNNKKKINITKSSVLCSCCSHHMDVCAAGHGLHLSAHWVSAVRNGSNGQ